MQLVVVLKCCKVSYVVYDGDACGVPLGMKLAEQIAAVYDGHKCKANNDTKR